MKKPWLPNTILAKVTVAFLAVMLILSSVYLYSYSASMHLLRKESIAAIEGNGQRQLHFLDRQLLNIKRSLFNAYATQDWGELAIAQGDIQDYQLVQQVILAQERLRSILGTSEMLADVYVHFPRWGRSISTRDGLTAFDPTRWQGVVMPLDTVGAQIIYQESEAFLTSRYQQENPELFSIDAQLSFQKLFQLFSDYGILGAPPMNTYLLNNKTGTLLQSDEHIDGITGWLTSQLPSLSFPEAGPLTLPYQGADYVVFSACSTYSDLRIIAVARSADLVAPFASQTKLAAVFTLVISLAALLMLLFFNRTIVRPITHMIEAFKPLEKGDFTVSLTSTSKDEFASLYGSFNHMVRNLQVLVSEVYEKELLVERANLKQLQSQIHPHFLYNSFYALSAMIKIGDNENAELFCAHLASFFRYITRGEADMVRLSDEWQHAENYLSIMAMRASSARVEFQAALPEGMEALQVPRLILQPLIENSFLHGGKTATDFHLRVTAECDGKHLTVSVEDNGKGLTDQDLAEAHARLESHQPMHEITGLLNIHRRLKAVFGPESGLSISRSGLGGFCVTATLVLPK